MQKLTEEIIAFLSARNWWPQTPDAYAKSISIEAAELLEVFQWKNHTQEEMLADPALLEKVKHELADVMIYSLELAALLKLNPETIIREKMEHNGKKYPIEAVRNNDQNYTRIKADHREKSKK